MALTATRVNRILAKLGFPMVRKAQRFEQQTNEYGEKLTWVIDAGDRQARTAYASLHTALAAVLEHHSDTLDPTRLTAKEASALRSIPSQVARLL